MRLKTLLLQRRTQQVLTGSAQSKACKTAARNFKVFNTYWKIAVFKVMLVMKILTAGGTWMKAKVAAPVLTLPLSRFVSAAV